MVGTMWVEIRASANQSGGSTKIVILLESGVAEVKSLEPDCSLLMMAINSDQVLLLGP